jgi:hypothetical protein
MDFDRIVAHFKRVEHVVLLTALVKVILIHKIVFSYFERRNFGFRDIKDSQTPAYYLSIFACID